jgi:hypothetical protein
MPIRQRTKSLSGAHPTAWAFPASSDFHRAVAETYGPGPGDFEQILGTFPVFTCKGPGFFAHLCQCLEASSRPKGVDERDVRTNGWYIAPAEADVIGELRTVSYTCLDARRGAGRETLQEEKRGRWPIGKPPRNETAGAIK